MIGILIFLLITSIMKLKTKRCHDEQWQSLKLEEERHLILYDLNGLRQQRWRRRRRGGGGEYQPQGLHGPAEEILDQIMDYM